MRQRHNLPGGDFDRVKRQHAWIRAVAHQLTTAGRSRTRSPSTTRLTTLSKSVATDSEFGIGQIGDLVTSLAGHRWHPQPRVHDRPHGRHRLEPDHTQSIVNLDVRAGNQLWTAVRQDKVPAWISSTARSLPQTVR